jgi:coenzyme F420 hydrogenase subunit beta
MNISSLKNISYTVDQGLCNTCGACSGVCKAEAIHFEEYVSGCIFPQVDNIKCTECGLCIEVCPGIHFGNTLRIEMPLDPFVGTATEVFVGRSANNRIYKNSQSGGVVTALLGNLFDTGKINAALVVKTNPGQPPRAEPLIAIDKKGIISAQKSKYSPVPLLSVLSQLNDIKGLLAIVGLPCQMHGLFNVFDVTPKLKERIIYKIGLICDRTLSCAAIDFFIIKAGMQNHKDVDVIFRDKSCNGYPGDVHVISKIGKSVVFDAKTRILLKDYLTPLRCHFCFDKMNVFSDVTIGDPHGIADIDRENGESVCIIRNITGSEIVQSAINNQTVKLRRILYTDVINGQKITDKKSKWKGFCGEWIVHGNQLPDYYDLINKNCESIQSNNAKLNINQSLTLNNFDSRKQLLLYIENNLKITFLNFCVNQLKSFKKYLKIKFKSMI